MGLLLSSTKISLSLWMRVSIYITIIASRRRLKVTHIAAASLRSILAPEMKRTKYLVYLISWDMTSSVKINLVSEKGEEDGKGWDSFFMKRCVESSVS